MQLSASSFYVDCNLTVVLCDTFSPVQGACDWKGVVPVKCQAKTFFGLKTRVGTESCLSSETEPGLLPIRPLGGRAAFRFASHRTVASPGERSFYANEEKGKLNVIGA